MPDGLHPNAAGLKLIAQCLTPLIEKLMHSNSTQQIASSVSTLNSITPTQGIGAWIQSTYFHANCFEELPMVSGMLKMSPTQVIHL